MANNDNEDSDTDLFRRELAGVKPLGHDRVIVERRRPPPVPAQTIREQASVREEMLHGELDYADLETGEELQFHRPGLQRGILRRLRRGQLSIQADLDLHGLRALAAQRTVAEFLRHAVQSRYRCVRIVHGKGHGSYAREPVLKRKLGGWLRRRDDVLAYCSARPFDGGTGAVYVLVKLARPS
jgi:DNA-nicking Smr family endonuclease